MINNGNPVAISVNNNIEWDNILRVLGDHGYKWGQCKTCEGIKGIDRESSDHYIHVNRKEYKSTKEILRSRTSGGFDTFSSEYFIENYDKCNINLEQARKVIYSDD